MPETAKQDLSKYYNSGLFSISTGGIDRYCCNITLTRRPSQKESKFSTKADKNIAKQSTNSQSTNLNRKPIYDVNNSKKTTDIEERVLYRLTIDSSLNTATRNDTSIVLPSIDSIERLFKIVLSAYLT